MLLIRGFSNFNVEYCLPMVRSDEEDVSMLLAGLIHTSDSLVSRRNALNASLVHSSMANHVRRSEVVHQELEFLLSNSLRKLVSYGSGTHFRIQVISGNLWGWDQFTLFALELLLNASVEEERDVGVLLGFSNMTLLEVLLAEPLSQDVAHVLRWEGDWERIIRFILGHGCDGDVLGVGEVGLGGTIDVTQELGDFANTI